MCFITLFRVYFIYLTALSSACVLRKRDMLDFFMTVPAISHLVCPGKTPIIPFRISILNSPPPPSVLHSPNFNPSLAFYLIEYLWLKGF